MTFLTSSRVVLTDKPESMSQVQKYKSLEVKFKNGEVNFGLRAVTFLQWATHPTPPPKTFKGFKCELPTKHHFYLHFANRGMNEISLTSLNILYQSKLKTLYSTISKPRQKCILLSKLNTPWGEKLGAKTCPAPACALCPDTSVFSVYRCSC